MHTGTVKWFNARKGIGMIAPLTGGQDVFVHFTAIECEGFRSLDEGQTVQFEMVNGTSVPHAQAVRLVSQGTAPVRGENQA
jgi:CspA family cold shock protein